MGYSGLKGHCLREPAFGKHLLVNFASRLDKRRFALPQAIVRFVIRDRTPHALGGAVFDPLQMLFTLNGASHVHDDFAGGCIAFDAVPEPSGGRAGFDVEL